MAYKISDKCIQCGACAGNCPCEAISEGDTMFVIDPEKCVDCGACADACPVEAIAAE
jgi:NAD-dependent dihydropyrimidine dehydrogenase PreA subunit